MQLPPDSDGGMLACTVCVGGARLVGVLGDLDERTCKFQGKLNLVTTCRMTIFEACSVKNLCLHPRCSEGRALFSFSVWLTCIGWIHQKRLREKQSEKED